MRKLVLICSVLWIWTCGGDGPTEPIELPTVQNIEFTLEEDTSKTFAFMGSDPLNRALTYSVSTQPQHGTLSINAGAGTYAPYANYHGADTFAYIATNVDGTSNIGTIVATVTPVDDEPNSMDVSATTDEDNAIDITLEAEEYDGDNIIFQVRNNPYGGSVTISEAVASYTPNPNWNGTDTFNFEAVDSNAKSILNVATATITVIPVNDAPSIENVNAGEAILNESIEISLSGNDIENDNLTFSIVSQPSIGTVVINGAVATYTATETGGDSFTYQAKDGRDDSNIATITTNNVTPFVTYDALSFSGNAIEASDGGFILVGGSKEEERGYDFLLAKIDVDGNKIWTKLIDEDSSKNCHINDVIISSDGGYILVGGSGGFDSPCKIVKVDSNGNTEWIVEQELAGFRQIIPNGEDYLLLGVNSKLYNLDISGNISLFTDVNGNFYGIDNTMDGGFILAGRHFQNAELGLISKIDSNGNEEWGLAPQLNGNLDLYSVVALSDGNYITSGFDPTEENTLYYAKINSSGNYEWTNTYTPGPESWLPAAEEAHDGNYIFVGGGRGMGLYVLKVDKNGNQIWDKSFMQNLSGAFGTTITKTSDGGYIVSGSFYDSNNEICATIIKIDSEGNQEW